MSQEPLSVLSMAEPKAPMKKQVRAALLLTWMAGSVLLGLWAATQRVAHVLQYHPDLPGVWVRGTDTALYVPWAYLTWKKTLAEQIPHALERGQIGMFVGGMLFVVGMRLLRVKRPRESIAHGSSRWARPHELAAMKLTQPNGAERWDGVVLGKMKDGLLLTHDGPEHVLVFAPTRSGKGVGLVVPTLLTWRHSVVVLDIKGENWDITAGHRARYSHAFRFDPTREDSVRFNPLDEIRIRTKDEIRDMQNLTKILCDPDGTGNATDHWSQSASMLLTGVILHVLYNEPKKTLGGVLEFLRSPERTSEQMYELMKKSAHPSIAQAGASMLNKADKERAGILSTAEKFLGLYEDPLIESATSKSDFKIEHLMDGAHPVSLYLVVPPNDMLRLRPLLRLLFTMMLGRLTEKLSHPQRLLFLLDEFPTLGRMDVLESALAFVAGYGMKIMLIAQSLSQFEGAYGPNNSVLDNCHVQVTFASGDDKTSKRVSEMLGQGTWFKKQEGESGKKGIFGLDNMSRSEVEYARPLLTPAEIKQLDETRGILMVAGRPPLLFHKVRYYDKKKEPRWQQRLHPAPAENKDLPARCKKCHALLMQHRQLASSEKRSPLPPSKATVGEGATVSSLPAAQPSRAASLMREDTGLLLASATLADDLFGGQPPTHLQPGAPREELPVGQLSSHDAEHTERDPKPLGDGSQAFDVIAQDQRDEDPREDTHEDRCEDKHEDPCEDTLEDTQENTAREEVVAGQGGPDEQVAHSQDEGASGAPSWGEEAATPGPSAAPDLNPAKRALQRFEEHFESEDIDV